MKLKHVFALTVIGLIDTNISHFKKYFCNTGKLRPMVGESSFTLAFHELLLSYVNVCTAVRSI